MSIWDTLTKNINRVTNSTFAGDSVVYFPYGSDSFSIRAPYWREHYSSDPDTEVQIRSTDPKLNVLHVDLRGHKLTNKDKFLVDGKMWSVCHIEDDISQKNSYVYLSKVALNI